MAKVKYYAKENSSIGTHSFYAVPIPNGTLTFDELLDEAMDGKSVEPSIAKADVSVNIVCYLKAVASGQTVTAMCSIGDESVTFVYADGRRETFERDVELSARERRIVEQLNKKEL